MAKPKQNGVRKSVYISKELEESLEKEAAFYFLFHISINPFFDFSITHFTGDLWCYPLQNKLRTVADGFSCQGSIVMGFFR